MIHSYKIAQKILEYLKIPSVIGFEEPFFRALETESKELNLKTESIYDRSGRRILLAVSSNDFLTDPILTAHIDRHGLYKLLDDHLIYRERESKDEDIEDVEYAATFIRRTHFDSEPLKLEMLQKICNYFVGETIQAYHPRKFNFIKSAYIADPGFCKIRNNLTFKIDDFIGLEAEDNPLIPIAFMPEHKILENNQIKGQIDNTLSVAILMHLFELGYKFTALFTTDEEIGGSWEHLMRWFNKNKFETNNLIVVDTSPYAQLEYAEELHNLGAITLRNRDNHSEFSPQITEVIRNIALKLEIPFDVKDETLVRMGNPFLGSTELGRLIKESEGRFSGTTIQIPTTEYHTNRETCSMESIENALKLFEAILSK